MKFSQEFIDKLKLVYPDFQDYHEMAQIGDEQLINALNSMCDETISNTEIVTEMERGKEGLHNLYVKAKRLLEREEIYFMAVEEFERSHSQDET